jgi:hypothetical protein
MERATQQRIALGIWAPLVFANLALGIFLFFEAELSFEAGQTPEWGWYGVFPVVAALVSLVLSRILRTAKNPLSGYLAHLAIMEIVIFSGAARVWLTSDAFEFGLLFGWIFVASFLHPQLTGWKQAAKAR